MVAVKLATALGLSEMDPVGSGVTGAVEARALDDGFKPSGLEGVAGAPVLRYLAGGASQDVGSEVADGNPGQNEEAGVVDDQVEPGALLRRCPSDEAWMRYRI